MLSQLETAEKVVGVKQSKKAICDGRAVQVFLAEDAERRVIEPLRELCEEHSVAVTDVPTMKQLGAAAGITIGAAVVAVTAF